MKKTLIGFTVLALMAMTAGPALGWWGGDDITVENDNRAKVSNKVEVDADTGKNDAEGGHGNDGGDSGSTVAIGGSNATGGDAGAGGGYAIIYTGNADADASVTNKVNTNYTKINFPCDDCDGDVDVDNESRARVKNRVEVDADTGKNDAEGGHGNDGGNSGCTVAKYGSNATGGSGGYGGGDAVIETGHAYSTATLFNVVNTNVTRIRR